MARLVLSTFGSLGDLHPLLAVGIGLRERGHEVVIATTEIYRARAEALGFGFHPLRPEVRHDDPALVALLMDLRKGTERILRDVVFPHLRATYDDLLAATRGADALLAGELVYPAPLLGEATGLPWATCALSPISLFSAWDPPVLPPFPALARLRALGLPAGRAVVRFARFATRTWSEPVHRLRRDLGLPPGGNPIFEGKYSPHLVLALFSRLLAEPQPDWPPHTVVTGFAFYDGKAEGARIPPELERFLAASEAAGEPPLVFTLGSAAVHDPGVFYGESAAAARALGRRAVLLLGNNPPPPGLPPEVFAAGSAPFSDLFPRAAAVVHQGGVGTSAQALRAGRPTLVMPYSHDQPDNAARLVRLGTARTLARRRYSAVRAARELRALLEDPAYGKRAAEVAGVIQSEDGVKAACDSIEARLLRR